MHNKEIKLTSTEYDSTYGLPRMKILAGQKDPSGNDNIFMIYDMFVVSGSTKVLNINMARYELGQDNSFTFRDSNCNFFIFNFRLTRY